MSKEVFELNPQQQKVVDHIQGPLLVVAGAGTGKTRVIIEKIGKLLDEGVDASAILAVTFTEKAAVEMLERLLLSRGGFQLDISITTFNGFGESILREFGSHIGVGRNFRLLSEQAQIVFVRERIDALKLDYFLPLTNLPDAIIDDILGVFSQLKQHVITPEHYIAYASKLPTNDEAELHTKRQHTELAQAYSTYIQLCRQEGVIDYDDQIFLALQLLEQRPNVKNILQNRFHTMFIDEFQDTNPMQSKLVDLLVGKAQNLIVVGDDDQSIYGFRGATLANILSFKDRYPKTEQVALTENYRSGQAILDAAYSLITHNNPHRLEHTLSINKRLTGKHLGEQPNLKRFLNPADELEWLAEDIAARIRAGEKPGSIAVLTRRRHTATMVHEALERLGVAHKLIGYSQDLYKQPLVRMLVELCRTLAEPNNNNSLHHTLTSELFNISNETVAPLAATARYEHERLEDLLLAEGKEDLVNAIGVLNGAREESTSLSIGRLLWKVVTDSGYKDRLLEKAAHDEEAAHTVGVLSQYFDTLRAYESIANQPTVIEYLVSLPALQSAGEKTDDGTLGISDDEVSILTVHKSKGLEWNTVYIPDCTEFSFPLRNTPRGLRIPDALKAASTSAADEHYAEERRLMYVAVTRARANLNLSFADQSSVGTKRKPSRFLVEMFDDTFISSLSTMSLAAKQQSLLDMPDVATPKIAVPKDIYDGNKVFLSVSQAATLLDCPLDFYYKYILRAPQDPTARTTYGTTMHALFEQINKDRKQDALLPLEKYEETLQLTWDKSGYASKGQQDRAFQQAQQTLRNFHADAIKNSAALYVEEKFLCELEPENIVLRGRYDAVFGRVGEDIEIRDYKTSVTVTTPEKAKSRATGSQQLTMYALAWQLNHDTLPTSVSLHFVDTGMTGSVKKTQRGIDGLRARLSKVAEDMKQGVFDPGKSHDYCIHP